MENFKLNDQLAKDCHELGFIDNSRILLMNNSLVPWLVIVPEVQETELYKLNELQQKKIVQQINILSEFIQTQYKTDKINVASIGNMVRQMHIHVVGRFETDYCWPGVVWGAKENEPYTLENIDEIKNRLGKNIHSFSKNTFSKL